MGAGFAPALVGWLQSAPRQGTAVPCTPAEKLPISNIGIVRMEVCALSGNEGSQSGKLADQPPQPLKPGTKKTRLWIRPHSSSYELPYYTSLPFRMSGKSLLRITMDLLGVAILLGSLWLVLHYYASGSLAGKGCTSQQSCNVQQSPRTGVQSSLTGAQTATVTPSPAPTPRRVASPITYPNLAPSPTLTRTPGPTLAPRLTPTPRVAILTVTPVTFIISYPLVCSQNLPTPFILMNTGSRALVWWVDKKTTSPGLRVTAASKNYLLQPERTVTANLMCRTVAGPDQYKLQLLYNGGSLTIPVQISR